LMYGHGGTEGMQNMPNWNEYKVLIGLCVFLITSTAAAIIYFTPLAFAEQTRKMIEQHETKEQLMYVENRIWELEKVCTDLRTEEWLCSDNRLKEQYDLKVERKILMNELGLED
jgi:hypothetical protein